MIFFTWDHVWFDRIYLIILQFIIGKPRYDLLTLSTTFYDFSVSRNLSSKPEMRQIGASGNQLTWDCRKPTGLGLKIILLSEGKFGFLFERFWRFHPSGPQTWTYFFRVGNHPSLNCCWKRTKDWSWSMRCQLQNNLHKFIDNLIPFLRKWLKKL